VENEQQSQGHHPAGVKARLASDIQLSIRAEKPGSVVQVAYLVPDVDAAIEEWRASTTAGPFFRTSFDQSTQIFRGQPTNGTLEIAIAFRQDMCIELMRFVGEGPSVYSVPGLPAKGLHHLMIATDDLDGDIARHEAAGEALIADGQVPGFGRAVFIDTMARLGHLTEYGTWVPPVLQAIETMRLAHLDWDGSDPIRPYPAI